MKKLSFLLSVILILSSLLVSCSDGGDGGAPPLTCRKLSI